MKNQTLVSFFAIAALFLLQACGSESRSLSVYMNDIPEIPVISGQQVLGTSFILTDANGAEDKYEVSFDEANKTTKVIDKSGKVVLEGQVQKVGNTILLSQKQGDKFTPHFMQLGGGKIIGWDQAKSLEKLAALAKDTSFAKDISSSSEKEIVWNITSEKQVEGLANSLFDGSDKGIAIAREEGKGTQIVRDLRAADYEALQEIVEEKKKNEPSLTPNPASTEFTIHFPIEGSYKMLMLSSKGKQVRDQSILQGDMIVDVSDLANGDYFIMVTDADGKKAFREKVTVQR